MELVSFLGYIVSECLIFKTAIQVHDLSLKQQQKIKTGTMQSPCLGFREQELWNGSREISAILCHTLKQNNIISIDDYEIKMQINSDKMLKMSQDAKYSVDPRFFTKNK